MSNQLTVVVVNDAESGADIAVFDGNTRIEVCEVSIDPGRGYTAAEWAEASADALDGTDGELREFLESQFGDAEDNPHIA